MGSDAQIQRFAARYCYFNPRSPRWGATSATLTCGAHRAFQSTLPTMGSDVSPLARDISKTLFQSTLPTMGSDDQLLVHVRLCLEFQSTLPTMGSDTRWRWSATRKLNFNPRSPRWGATAEKCICMQHFREFTEYYPLRHGDARCIAPQDCIIQAFFGAKKRCFYVRLCFALKNKGVRG